MIGVLVAYLTLHHSSPGPLTHAHAQAVKGFQFKFCDRCHQMEGLIQGCLDCHTEIVQQLDQGQGYHAYLIGDKDPTCRYCHPEHHGREFNLMGALSWQGLDPNAFAHPHVSFTLSGRHEELPCQACHQAKLKTPFSLPDFPDQPRRQTYLGLTQDCIDCHTDVHNDELGPDCETCHGQEQFKPVSNFKHDEFFVLTGQHAKAGCAACHHLDPNALRSGDKDALRVSFKEVRGTTCQECHETPHRLIRGTDCQNCHETDDINWALGQRGIDATSHATLGFPLYDPHVSVSCDQCHLPDLPYHERYPDPNDSGYNRQENTCQGCHQDPHGEQFTQRFSACMDCHTKTKFKPSTVDGDHHAQYYALEGKHLTTACEQCHPVEQPLGTQRFTDTPRECKACHEDPHGGQFAEGYSDCSACHNQDQFKPSTYGHAEHEGVFKLVEAHAQIDCAKCHLVDTQTAIRRYRKIPHTCGDCHGDPHQGQFDTQYNSCLDCHTQQAFQPTTFDLERHNQSYPLLGSHRPVACDQCHPQEETTQTHRFIPTPKACKTCHGDPHGGQFAAEVEQRDCIACHQSNCASFLIRPYDHGQRTDYILTGEHAQANCDQCHKQQITDSSTVRQYRPTSRTCATCHRDVHRGQFQHEGLAGCERCHDSTHSWAANRFNHDRDTRFALDKAHARVACHACHPAAPQSDGQSVIQYRPIPMRCEDCHGFTQK
jgi:hypothetical protein